LPTYGFPLIKNNRVEEICSRYEEKRNSKTEAFLDCWFSPAVQDLLSKAAKRF
jgi:hypothetical protein